MASKKPAENLSLTGMLQGSVLVLVSNLVYIGNNYLVVWTKLEATEVTLVRGSFQMALFSCIIWKGQKLGNEQKPGKFKIFRNTQKFCLFRSTIIYNSLVCSDYSLWVYSLHHELCKPCSDTFHADR